MDTAISNGDFLLDSRNRPIKISGVQEFLQRALIRLSVKKGNFTYDKNLGSRLYTLNSQENNMQRKALSLVCEALNDMTEIVVRSVSTEFIDNGEKLKLGVTLSINGNEEDVVITI
ncbi:MAG: hypothetical protein RUMPE_00878 [Eubacteriales bacterium SKADARSKE-1]|nr:hypothetical protein [Eubacteriales bacterium SKADARSKE-1]